MRDWCLEARGNTDYVWILFEHFYDKKIHNLSKDRTFGNDANNWQHNPKIMKKSFIFLQINTVFSRDIFRTLSTI